MRSHLSQHLDAGATAKEHSSRCQMDFADDIRARLLLRPEVDRRAQRDKQDANRHRHLPEVYQDVGELGAA